MSEQEPTKAHGVEITDKTALRFAAMLTSCEAEITILRAKIAAYEAIVVETVPGPYGEGVEQGASPEYLKSYIDEIHKELDSAEERLSNATALRAPQTEEQARAWFEVASLFDDDTVGISFCEHVKNTILATRTERDKLLVFYTEIVKELGDDLVLKRIGDLTNEVSIRSDEATGLAGQLKEVRAALDIAFSALEDIRTHAHCLAKAGPLNTPTLDKAWSRFMEIDAKAANAIGQVRAARDI